MAMACDVECQKQKKLKTLLSAYNDASQTAGSDPKGYERAKIAYFSLRDGPTWLHNYNEQKAQQEAEQNVRKIKSRQAAQEYNSQQNHSEDDYSFAKYVQTKKDENDVQWRMYSFGSSEWMYYLELVLTICLSLYIVVKLFMIVPNLVKNYTGNS
jgi:hypothetical protein